MNNCTVSATGNSRARSIVNSGTLNITGTSSFIDGLQYAIYTTAGTVTIGSSSSPGGTGIRIRGSSSYGLYKSGGTVNWYSGSIQGHVSPGYSGTVNIPSGYKVNTVKDSYYGYYTSTLAQ